MEHLKLSLLVSSFVIPLLLATTILVIARKDFSKKVMGFALLNAFYVFLANYFYFQQMFKTYSYMHSLHIAAVLWLFPSIFLYIRSIVGDNFRKDLLHLVPGAVFGCISAILFYGFLSVDERVYYLSNYRGGTTFEGLNLKIITIFRMVDVALIIIQVVYYAVIFIRVPQKYDAQLKQEYSNIENFSINWLHWFNYGFVIVGILCVLFYVFNPFHEENELFLVVFLFAISAFIWIIGIWSFKQKRPEQKVDLPEYVAAIGGGKNADERKIERALLQYFEKEKPYLNPELSLTDVCKNIGTNRTYLSNFINSELEMNFNTFVNEYRLKEVLEYQKQNPSASYATLADIAGFGSVSSLKRALATQKQTHEKSSK